MAEGFPLPPLAPLGINFDIDFDVDFGSSQDITPALTPGPSSPGDSSQHSSEQSLSGPAAGLPFDVAMRRQQQERSYHSKRPHKKSRAGCKNCKARKVKCDEARPACKSCRLRKVECVYVAPLPAKEPSPLSAQHATYSSNLSTYFTGIPTPVSFTADYQPPHASKVEEHASLHLLAEPLFCPADVDKSEMKLLWFYTNNTCRSFSTDNGIGNAVEHIMRGPLVQVAFETPFLMDTLFALSSLHLRSLNQSSDVSRFLGYQERSFEGYRNAIQEAKRETFPALIANSLIIIALTSQSFRDPQAKDLYIIDWMTVWKGIHVMMDLVKLPAVYESGLQGLFYRPSMNLAVGGPAAPKYLFEMFSAASLDDVDYPDLATYNNTLELLGMLYYHIREGFTATMRLRIITWFTFVPAKFVELCRLKRPRALVILAHHALFLKLTNRAWWLKDVGNRTLRDLCKHIGDEWAPYMTVPLSVRDVTDRLSIIRLLIRDDSFILPMDIYADTYAEELDMNLTEKHVFLRSEDLVIRDNDDTDSSLQS